MTRTNSKIRNITIIAVLSAIAFLVTYVIRISVIPSAQFLKYDPKDVVIIIGGFLLGPLSAFAISAVVSFLEMITVSTSGPIGLIMNIISSCSIACTAAFIYKKKRTVTGAVIGLVSGIIAATVMMLLWNYLITPIYMSASREAVAKMLIPVFLPFNVIKGSLNAGITLLVYKPLSTALKKLNIMPSSDSGSGADISVHKASKINIGVLCVACFVVITCVLLILVLQGRM